MAFDDTLAERIRDVVPELPGEVTERRMFGGLAFMLDGRMVVGVIGDELMVRLGPDRTASALTTAHVREMDVTGRPARAMVFVGPQGLTGRRLRAWILEAADYVRTLPPRSAR